jgi:hypothetical protein
MWCYFSTSTCKQKQQNAEDAEASYMKIVYDSRNVNNEKVDQKKRPFKKFFKVSYLKKKT